ncbi:lactoylglutathione lyase [Pseudomaricurvus alkylphenolicus]|uniref:VOC family protein n=1 Tax=Pseudomaricurvus alkylphenolicus TaxID=1306991 RepID=UPI00141FF73B|nr:VOC family protein [Pseudomaricurvus alkylphenolicus]NIB44115.1 lactoylglutathione lyase [Pseudomaricurvus alkylphenolicus]
MFDLLMSADMMLEDPDGMAELLSEKLGIYQHKRWRQAFDNHPYIAHFLRVHKSLAVSPTRIEPQWHLDKPNPGDPMFHDFLESLKDYQGRHRPMMTHAVVVSLSKPDFDALISKLMRRDIPFRMAQRTPEMPFDRLWLGTRPENPIYSPEVDGGLCIEVMGTEPLCMPEDVFADEPVQPTDLNPGDMVRVSARGFLVRDLDDTLRRLSTNLDWEPKEVVQLNGEGYRRARMPFRALNSASLDLIEPTYWDSDAGHYLNNWGPGLYYIRIAVNDLKAKADLLKERGVKFSWVDESEAAGGGSLIRVDPSELRGQMFEFEEV